VLKPAPPGVHVPAAYPREPAGQRSDHLPAPPVTAAARLRLNHHSTATSKAQARIFRLTAAAASGDDLAAYRLSWRYMWWQVLGSNQRRLSRRFYREPPYRRQDTP
jgi:hypothetical protein